MRPGNFQFRALKFLMAISFFTGSGFSYADTGLKDTLQPGKTHGNYPSFYQEHIRVDGNLADWPSKMFYDHTEARLLYAVGNDSTKLFFCLQVLEQSEQMNIIHEGLTIRIEPGGRKKESVLIQFPFGPAKPVDPPSAGPGDHVVQPGGTNPPSQSGDRPAQAGYQQKNHFQNQGKPRMRPKPKSFSAGVKISGFRESIDGIYPADTAVKHVEAAMAYDTTGALVIEISVPLSCFKNDPRMSKYISLGFVVTNQGGNSHEEAPPGGTTGEGHVHGGGAHNGGMPGGGVPGGGQGEMGGQHGEGHGSRSSQNTGTQNQSKDYKISHKFLIAPVQ